MASGSPEPDPRREWMRSLRAQGLSIREIMFEAQAGCTTVMKSVEGMPKLKTGRPALYKDPAWNRRFLAAWDGAEYGDRLATARAFGFKNYNSARITAYRIRKGKLPS